MFKNKVATIIAEKIKPYQIKIELTLFSILTIALLLNGFEVSFGNTLLILILGILQVLYAIMAYQKQENKIETILNHVLNFSFSILLVGVLFMIMHWVGFNMMVNAGLGVMGIGSMSTIVYRVKKKEERLITNNLIRAVAIFSLFVVTYFGSAKNNSTNQDIETQNEIEKLKED